MMNSFGLARLSRRATAADRAGRLQKFFRPFHLFKHRRT